MQQYDILSLKELHSQLPKGIESEWYNFAQLVIVNGKVAISDPQFFRDTPRPPTFDIANGAYEVSLKFITYPDDDKRVSRLRILQGETAVRGNKLDEVNVDFGQVGIFDPILLDQVSVQLSPEKAFEVFEAFKASMLYGIAHFDDGIAQMPFVSSGFGDGSYSIYKLLRTKELVGLEVIFIGDEIFDQSPGEMRKPQVIDAESEKRRAEALEFFAQIVKRSA